MRIRTERLLLAPLSTGDAEAVHELWTRVPVRRFLWDGERVPPDETLAIVSASMVALRDNEYGLWSARLGAGEPLVGITGFWPFFDPPRIQLLYLLAPDAWGRGLATEMARAMLRFGFEEHGYRTIEAAVDAPNEASIRVAERIGLREVKRDSVQGKATVFYELRRAEHDPLPRYALERGERAGRPGGVAAP